MGVRSVVLAYLVATHVLLLATSPCYRYEVGRGLKSVRSKLSKATSYLFCQAQKWEFEELPQRGVYASTELLNAIQRNMQLSGEHPGVSTYIEQHMFSSSNSLEAGTSPRTALDSRHGTQSDSVYVSHNLVAYMSATDVFKGQGWKARSAFFVYLLAPRYLLAAARSRFTAELNLLNLASADLPAVVQWNRSMVPAVGYELSCTSPSLSLGLGPQPFANCSVWLVEPSESTQAAQQRLQIALGHKTYLNRAAAAAQRASAAATARESTAQQDVAGTSRQDDMNDNSTTVHGSNASGAPAGQACSSTGGCTAVKTGGGVNGSKHRSAAGLHEVRVCPARSQVASWIILPDNSPEGVAKHLQEIGFAPEPYLAGRQYSAEPGLLSSFLDVWLFFPRAKLLQLLPAMSSLQQVLFGYVVVLISYSDLWQLANSLQQLQNNAVQGGAVLGPLLGIGAWGYLMLGLSVVLQLLMMTAVKATLAAVIAHLSVYALHPVLWAMSWVGQLMEVPLVRLLSWCVDFRDSLFVSTASAVTFFAGVRLQDVVCVVLLVFVSLLLLGMVVTFLEDMLFWETSPAAGVALCVAAGMLATTLYGYFKNYGPACVWPAPPEGSSPWQVGLDTSDIQSMIPQLGSGHLAGIATKGDSTAATLAASVLAAGWEVVDSWQEILFWAVETSQDILMMMIALCVWWELDSAGDVMWKACVDLALEMGILVECISNCLVLLLAGASVRQAWARFWLQMQQRLPGNAPVGLQGAVQAQLVIRAQQEQFADLGHTADALRALADELENINGRGGMLHHQQQAFFMGGRVIVPASRRGPQLGTHWPAALSLDFDIDDVRAELGIEVPRGFVCPLTLDIMRQPALLISSNIAVPSSYEKEAITRWLEESRRDPKSRRHLAADAQLVPNFDLYRAIEDWGAHVQALQVQHRQQATAAATAAAQDAAGCPGQPSPAAAAAISGGGITGMAQRAAAAAGTSRPSTSSGTLGSLLASARDVVGTAAAAAAAAAAAGTGRRRHRQHAPSGARAQQRAHAAAAAEVWDLCGDADVVDDAAGGLDNDDRGFGPGDGLQADAAEDCAEQLAGSRQHPLAGPHRNSHGMHAAWQHSPDRPTSRGRCHGVPSRAATHAGRSSHLDSDPEDHLLSDTDTDDDDVEEEVRSYPRSSRGVSQAAAAGARVASRGRAQPHQPPPETAPQYPLRNRRPR